MDAISTAPIVRELEEGFRVAREAIEALVHARAVRIGDAEPPHLSGVYLFLIEERSMYVGEAKGSGGLRDRILNKHVAGDEGHVLQKHFEKEFPDRAHRRNHIRCNVFVKWVVVESALVPFVERAAIWLLQPPMNRR